MTSAARRRVALITGAGRGVGRAIAIALAQEGFALALTARTFEELQETRRLCEIPSRESLIVLADLTLFDGPAQVCGATLDHYGRLDVLINGAHGAESGRSILELEDSDQDRLLAVNLRAPIALARMAGTQMCTQVAGGVIISFLSGPAGSVDAIIAVANAGIVAFSRTAASELRSHQIKIAAIPVLLSDHRETAAKAMTFINAPCDSPLFNSALEA